MTDDTEAKAMKAAMTTYFDKHGFALDAGSLKAAIAAYTEDKNDGK